jgi:hypothetical protein
MVAKITLTLPRLSDWPARTQTLSVLGSSDGTNFTTTVPANYTLRRSTPAPKDVGLDPHPCAS